MPSKNPVGFACRKCKRPVCAAVCPRCQHDNKDWIETIKKMYERATSLNRGFSSEFGSSAPKEVAYRREESREHWRERSRWREYERASDRGITRPKLPEGFEPIVKLLNGDAETQLKKLDASSADCCVTSPPYYHLRDYGVKNDLGLLPSIAEFLNAMSGVFKEVRRVLKPTGVFFLEIGDSYAGSGHPQTALRKKLECCRKPGSVDGVARKGKCLIPERLAISLADSGWTCRSGIVIEKSNLKPEPANIDRPATAASPMVYMMVQGDKYYYKPILDDRQRPLANIWRVSNADCTGCGRHPAPMPLMTAQNCVQMGCPAGGTVLDPFCGSGQVGFAALEAGCHFVGIDASAKYLKEICVPRLVGK